MRFLKSFLVMINWRCGEQCVICSLCNASDMCILGYGCFGQLHFRQKGGDNFYTGLSPHEPCVSSGFVFTSDQVCSHSSMVIQSIVGVYFSHGFGVYSPICGVFPSVQWFHKHCTRVPILWNIDTV